MILQMAQPYLEMHKDQMTECVNAISCIVCHSFQRMPQGLFMVFAFLDNPLKNLIWFILYIRNAASSGFEKRHAKNQSPKALRAAWIVEFYFVD